MLQAPRIHASVGQSVAAGMARRHALGETLTAAVLLGIFVIAIAWIGKRVDARLKRK